MNVQIVVIIIIQMVGNYKVLLIILGNISGIYKVICLYLWYKIQGIGMGESIRKIGVCRVVGYLKCFQIYILFWESSVVRQ